MKRYANREELSRAEWWWTQDNGWCAYVRRPGGHFTKPLPFVQVDDGTGKIHQMDGRLKWPLRVERGAWSYELARRIFRKTNLPPWPKLSWEEMDFLTAAFEDGSIDGSTTAMSTGRRAGFSDSGWTFNLMLSDGTLQKAFLAFVREQRQKHGITRMKGQGGKAKPKSWLWVEVMDLDFYGLRTDADFDTSSLSKAQSAAPMCAARFEQGLKDLTDQNRRRVFPKIVTLK